MSSELARNEDDEDDEDGSDDRSLVSQDFDK